jgi:tRNA pseudouridine55 synthase|tara:strand:+ start:387 stop:1292 length:906 start_codon:yes stop_codon:yes gene_type:complete
MQVKRLKVDVDGLLLIDKPLGLSSNQALSKIKFLFSPKKVGHTGTLDPMATGLLPICLGEATKFSSYLLNADKTYVGLIRLGYKSSTGDKEGEIIKQEFDKIPSKSVVKRILKNFIGPIDQLPPMFSALKHKGKPLYLYAREGINIPRPKRKILIHEIELLDYQGDELRLKIKCSKGTYIRTLAEDIGDKLNVGAYLLELNRTGIGSLSIDSAVKIEQIEEIKEQERVKLLLPVDELLSSFQKLILNCNDTTAIKDGKIIDQSGKTPGFYRLYEVKDEFIGLGEIDKIGKLKAKRLISLKN